MKQQTLKYTPLTAGLFNYLCESRVGSKDPVLEALRKETARLGEIAWMQIGPDQGTFMTLLAKAIGARRAIEVGSFTGYSAICIARGLPANGKLICFDASKEWTDIARRFWKRAGLEKKIELRLGPAIENLKKLKPTEKFEFAFIDAHKPEYEEYYELILPHMKPNGLILFDNMFWGGRLGKKKPITNPNGRMIDRLNHKLPRDKRVESVLLSIGDGLQLCRVTGVE